MKSPSIPDLSLVPLEDLAKEINNRFGESGYVLGVFSPNNSGKYGVDLWWANNNDINNIWLCQKMIYEMNEEDKEEREGD